MNKGIVFWGIAALMEITQMWKNRILEFAKGWGGKLLERAHFKINPKCAELLLDAIVH